jgi:hypothetical protein
MRVQPAGFCVAAFAFDGQLEGTGYWELGKLSGKWLAICREHLAHHGDVFDVPWAGALSHIRVKLTAGSGVALLQLSVNERPATSIALASGRDPVAEARALEMFVASLRRVNVVRAAAGASEPFQDALTLRDRPAMITVAWPPTGAARQDHQLVRELSVHLGGAFFFPSSH